MRVFGYLIVFFVLVGFSSGHKNDYLQLSSKRFTVEGSTSLGSFTCNYDIHTEDALFLGQKTGFTDKVPVKEFGCGNFLLNRDFRKTLKEKEYPFVAISLSNVLKQGENYSYNLDIDLAGKKKNFQNLVLTKEGKNLKGSIELKFSDFDLYPPNKLGGAIKVNENIKISILFRTQ